MTTTNDTNPDLDLLVRAGVRRPYAVRLLAAIGEGRALSTLTMAELTSAGVPKWSAVKIEAAITLGRRATERPYLAAINTARDVWHALRDRVAGLDQEVFYVLPLNIRNQLIGDAPIEVGRGSVCGVEVHPREVFRAAIRTSAAGVIVAHNHPSGDPTPSPEDLEVTRRVRDVGITLGIPVIDHVVVTGSDYCSIIERHGADL